ncbi:MAG: glycosyltransferase family 39 protein [Pirellulaceae bacterium]
MPFLLSYRWSLFAILACALALRLAAGAWWQQRLPAGKTFGFPDSESYWELGRKIARGEPYEFGPERLAIFRTPGYPILLAGLFLLAGDEPPVSWARALSAICGTIAVGGVASLARLLFDERTALLAATLTALYPEAIAASTFVLSEAPFGPLMVFQLVAWTRAWRADSGRQQFGWAAAAGVLGGLATLMRPSWLLFVPFAIAAGMASVRFFRSATQSAAYRRHMLIGATLLATLCATLAPWWIRNYAVAGRFVPTSLQVGASLYDGWGPQATGASDMQFVPQFIAEQHQVDRDQADRDQADRQATLPPRGTFEDRLDRRLRNASLAWATNHPVRVLQLAGIKFLRMWNPLPNAAEFGTGTLRAILALTYTPLIALALVGAWRFTRRDWPYLLCLLPAFYFTGLHMIFVSSIRYRQPAMLVLIVLAAGILTRWLARPTAAPST